MSDFQAPKGVPDYLPPESAEFVAIRDGLLTAARRAGYGDVELPIRLGPLPSEPHEAIHSPRALTLATRELM